MDINTLLRNVIASGAASIPVSLVSGQGLGQTAINALATGAGAGIGTPIAGSYGALGGAVTGNVLANVFGTDRNERNYDDLSKYGAATSLEMEGRRAMLGAYDQTVNQLMGMVPKSKQEEAMNIVQGNLQSGIDNAEMFVANAPEMDKESMDRAISIIQQILQSTTPIPIE